MVGRFPFNSCETTSLLFGKLIRDAFPSKEVYFVDGFFQNSRERHFWIEIQGLCFDLTADQFKEIDFIFYGDEINKHNKYFSTNSKTNIDTQLLENDFYTSKKQQFETAISYILKTE